MRESARSKSAFLAPSQGPNSCETKSSLFSTCERSTCTDCRRLSDRVLRRVRRGAERSGLHNREDLFYPEIVDPVSEEPLPDGIVGELAFTSLTREARPLVRYCTRCLARLLPGTARAMRRMQRVVGRGDDMPIIRSVNLFPTRIEEIIVQDPRLSPHFYLEAPRPGRLDELAVIVKASRNAADEAMRDEVAKDLANRAGSQCCGQADRSSTSALGDGIGPRSPRLACASRSTRSRGRLRECVQRFSWRQPSVSAECRSPRVQRSDPPGIVPRQSPGAKAWQLLPSRLPPLPIRLHRLGEIGRSHRLSLQHQIFVEERFPTEIEAVQQHLLGRPAACRIAAGVLIPFQIHNHPRCAFQAAAALTIAQSRLMMDVMRAGCSEKYVHAWSTALRASSTVGKSLFARKFDFK